MGKVLFLRKGSVHTIPRGLPTGYTRLEYIQANGSQYIDTGIKETNDTAVSCKFFVSSASGDYLYGSQQNESSMGYNGLYRNNTLEYNYKEISFTENSTIEMTQEVSGSTNNITINGNKYSATIGTAPNASILIFATRYKSSVGGVRKYAGTARLYAFKIKQAGELAFDAVPCINASGSVGLYDLVGRQFYGNAGTGVFIAPGTLPYKGQLITMDLGNGAKQYRVLKVDGTVAKVLAMYEYLTDQVFNTGGNWNYEASPLALSLNRDFFATLSETARDAISVVTLTQYQYAFSTAVFNATTHASHADYSTKAYVAMIPNYKVYALGIEDIEEYFNGTFSKEDVWEMFWGVRSAPSVLTYPWLRDVVTGAADAWYVSGSSGFTYNYTVSGAGNSARPAFLIDLSKIKWGA